MRGIGNSGGRDGVLGRGEAGEPPAGDAEGEDAEEGDGEEEGFGGRAVGGWGCHRTLSEGAVAEWAAGIVYVAGERITF